MGLMMKIFIKFASFTAMALISGNLYADTYSTQCGKDHYEGSLQFDYSYCLTTPDHPEIKHLEIPKVLFFFHPKGGSEKSWHESSFSQVVQKRWDEKNPGVTPTVISFSMGSETNIAQDGMPQILLQNILPHLEEKLDFAPQVRLLAGMSIGGWNATQLMIEDQAYFEKSALVCPAIMRIHPWSPYEEYQSYLQRTGANGILIQYLLYKMKSFFGDLETFKPFDIYEHAPEVLSSLGPQLFVAANSRDNFGFQEGALDFVNMAKEKNMSVQWNLWPGRHCQLEDKQLLVIADFLQ